MVSRTSVLVAAVVVLVTATACGGSGDQPAASGRTPSSTPTSTVSPSGAETGSGDLACLIAGSPWKVSIPDLESQFPAVMRGINVTDVHMTGEQTFTVTPDLRASFSDTTTNRITVAMSHAMTMVMVQTHHGRASGQLRVSGNTITAQRWSGGISGSTKVTINGRAGAAPFNLPSGGIGDHPMTFTCADGSLMLSVEGSPFQYLFQPARD